MVGSLPSALAEDGLDHARGHPAAAVVLAHVNRVHADVVAVEDAEARCHHATVQTHRDGDLVLGDGVIHGGNDAPVDDVVHALEREEALHPGVAHAVLDGEGNLGILVEGEVDVIQVARHDRGVVLDRVVAVGEKHVEVGVADGADLEHAGRLPAVIDALAVGNLLREGEVGHADLLHAVGPVGVEARVAQNPAVIDLHLPRRPRVEREVLDLLDFCVHGHDVPIQLPADRRCARCRPQTW